VARPNPQRDVRLERLSDAQLYTKKADRKRLAARALAKWTRPSSDDVVGHGELVHLHLEKERA
jgi:hypothetical protein